MSSSTAAARPASPGLLLTSRDWERLRFTACIALYGATVGGCAILVNFLSRVQVAEIPQHMGFNGSLFFGCVGAATGAIVAAPMAYAVYGQPRAFSFTPWRRRGPRGWIAWLALGFGYALAYPFALGIALPLVFRFHAAWERLISVPELVIAVLDVAMRSPLFAIAGAFQHLFTGFTAALVFLVGARTIGFLNSSTGSVTAKLGTWAMALGISVGVAALLTFVPEPILVTFGALR